MPRSFVLAPPSGAVAPLAIPLLPLSLPFFPLFVSLTERFFYSFFLLTLFVSNLLSSSSARQLLVSIPLLFVLSHQRIHRQQLPLRGRGSEEERDRCTANSPHRLSLSLSISLLAIVPNPIFPSGDSVVSRAFPPLELGGSPLSTSLQPAPLPLTPTTA